MQHYNRVGQKNEHTTHNPCVPKCLIGGVLFHLHDRLAIAKSAELCEIVPGSHVYLAERSENALYIIVSGVATMEVRHPVSRAYYLALWD